ncbi:MAG: Asp-tRNA(Asn)/Glu-tRNA(Gln) amidotransferase GatCAB subunit C [Ignavibacteriae bacterium HGW-Ignavibacteriae-3]|nr:MAG: Asp-tRNA(Asn)/Glu-tRNA(Gln) amidotransferase GatCAB subunit C [Ignavibacteriae bacterium HGW-Ignavibacteriae-3]
MSVTRKEVEHIAQLARLRFKDDELENFTHQLNEILSYVEKLNELDTDNVEPLSHPVEDENVFREDILKTSSDREEALKNAPSRTDEFFKVPKVISQD